MDYKNKYIKYKTKYYNEVYNQDETNTNYNLNNIQYEGGTHKFNKLKSKVTPETHQTYTTIGPNIENISDEDTRPMSPNILDNTYTKDTLKDWNYIVKHVLNNSKDLITNIEDNLKDNNRNIDTTLIDDLYTQPKYSYIAYKDIKTGFSSSHDNFYKTSQIIIMGSAIVTTIIGIVVGSVGSFGTVILAFGVIILFIRLYQTFDRHREHISEALNNFKICKQILLDIMKIESFYNHIQTKIPNIINITRNNIDDIINITINPDKTISKKNSILNKTNGILNKKISILNSDPYIINLYMKKIN